ncbi:MAG: excinuclease ABC subunit UvrC [Flavobacteriales bacterium]|nr:excinuclease ABC subunit UvrC [Flavobacteriales bacterium]
MASEKINLLLKTIPKSPGVYQYFNKEGVIIYVGKAKNLKNRVLSYFNKEHDDAKTRILVRKIENIEYIVVETEMDALLLENNLIKKYQPKYNILLKDDKTYPWICIKKERFPRVFLTRNMIKDGSEYFGPYASVRMANYLLSLIKELYPLRTCKHDLSEQNIMNGKYKVCLDYHIGKCKGACENEQSHEEYMSDISSIRNIVRGNFNEAIKPLNSLMLSFAENMEFEEAQAIKVKLESLKNYQAKSTIVNPKINNVDVFSIISDEQYAYVNFLKIMNGSIIQSHTMEIKKKLNESDKEIIELAIVEVRQRFESLSRELFVPFNVDLHNPNLKITIPKIGDKLKIIELSERNAKYLRLEKLKQVKITDPDRHTNRLMSQMKKDLRLSEEPRHIECFDNSNIQGTNPVAACVVFRNGKPAKRDYRHFNIKTVEGPDDYASMTEVVYRRYKRMIDEGESLPQFVVIDGGKGQLNAALKSFDDLGIRGKVAIVGIAKRLEELFYPDDPIPLYLDKKSETLKVIQRARDEAHRFGITHHRNKRSKSSLTSELEAISGIGEKTIADLMRKFKSVKRMKEATRDELAEVVGLSRASKIVIFFKEE